MNSKDMTGAQALEIAFQHHQEGRLGQAQGIYRQILVQEPRNAELLHLLGVALFQDGKLEEAVDWIRRAIQENPDQPTFHGDLVNILAEAGKLEEAVKSYGRFLEFNSSDASVYYNLGNVFLKHNACDKAESAYRRALNISPDYADAHKDLGITLLLCGRLEEGWGHYEWRRKTEGLEHLGSALPHLYWDGSSLKGKTIFLYTEQGFGDAIHFIRYCKILAESGAKVMLACDRVLWRLFEGVPGVDQLVDIHEEIPDFDFHASLLSLPGILKTTLETIPNQVPYIRPPKDQKAPGKVLSGSETLNVGIVWAGSPQHANDKNRSVCLKKFGPILKNGDIRFFSLQVGDSCTDISKFDYENKLRDLGDTLTDFSVTAAVMDYLDLLISVDTSVVHLAGAMGKPVWVLLPFSPDWRWMLGREDSPWYPTMRLFRQKETGNWDSVFAEVERALCRFMEIRR